MVYNYTDRKWAQEMLMIFDLPLGTWRLQHNWSRALISQVFSRFPQDEPCFCWGVHWGLDYPRSNRRSNRLGIDWGTMITSVWNCESYVHIVIIVIIVITVIIVIIVIIVSLHMSNIFILWNHGVFSFLDNQYLQKFPFTIRISMDIPMKKPWKPCRFSGNHQ